MLQGKTGLIFGVANKRSIAWAIAQALAGAGARLAFTFQGERLEAGVRELAGTLDGSLVTPCDVTRDEDLDRVFDDVDRQFGGLDILVHSVAFAAKEDLEGRFVDTTRANFLMALDISAYSLPAMVRRAEPLMARRGGGSVLTMTYLGGERAVPNYNVMGVAKAALDASVRYLAAELGASNIRVNAISAGPIKTLAASGIGDFRYILKWNEYNAPMRRTVTIEDVGDAAVYLLSNLSRSVTGEVHHVDSGYHVVGMKAVDAPDISVVKET